MSPSWIIMIHHCIPQVLRSTINRLPRKSDGADALLAYAGVKDSTWLTKAGRWQNDSYDAFEFQEDQTCGSRGYPFLSITRPFPVWHMWYLSNMPPSAKFRVRLFLWFGMWDALAIEKTIEKMHTCSRKLAFAADPVNNGIAKHRLNFPKSQWDLI